MLYKELDATRDLPIYVIRDRRTDPYPLHSHDFTEIVLIVSGTGIQVINGIEYRLEPGMVFVIKQGDKHAFTEVQRLDLYNIIIPFDKMVEVLRDIKNQPGFYYLFVVEPRLRPTRQIPSFFRLAPYPLSRIFPIAESMVEEIQYRAEGFQSVLLGQFVVLSTLLARAYDTQKQLPTRLDNISRALAFLEQNYHRSPRIGEAAALAHLSERQFNRVFKELLGRSPLDYLLHRKIDEGKRLLETSSTSITEIAYSVGFEDSNYFSRLFKNTSGLSPQAYRKIHSRGRGTGEVSV